MVMDLDETLIHCMTIQDTTQLSLRERPYLFNFLDTIKKLYEVVSAMYADGFLDILDPKRDLIQQWMIR